MHICHEELTELEQGIPESPEILVVGTFNPKITDNTAEWFYGREINEFWFLFPRMLGHKSIHLADLEITLREHPAICQKYCDQHNILIIDLIKEINHEIKGYTDGEINEVSRELIIPFDFKSAFKKFKPKKVLFTFKGKGGKIIGQLKKEFIEYLEKEIIKYCEVPSGSPFYRKGRRAKLDEWREEFEKIK